MKQKPRHITMDDITWEKAKAQYKKTGFESVSDLLRFLIINKAVEKI